MEWGTKVEQVAPFGEEIRVNGSQSHLPPNLSAEVAAHPSSDIIHHCQLLLAGKEK